ncbi:MAG TPA: hypothetical protein VFV66_36080 [Nonomuraea sp.]|nr:hypothetical protein [Nonomuraea sp.]
MGHVGKVALLEVFRMRNGVRHLLGAGTGLLTTPLLAAGLGYGAAAGSPRAERIAAWVPIPPAADWFRTSMFVAALVVIGVLAGSRLSPLAALLPGLALTALGAALPVRLAMGGDHRLGFDLVPGAYLDAYAALLGTWALPAGVVLLVAAAFPSRWRGRAQAPEEPPPPVEEEAPERAPLPKRIPSRY